MKTLLKKLAKANNHLFWGLLLIFITAGIFLNPSSLFKNTYLGPVDLLFHWYPYQTNQLTATPQNYLLSDQALQFIPWRVFTSHWIQKGTLPLWNSAQYCGAPFLANSQSALLYPSNLMSWFLPLQWGLFLVAFSKLLVSGWGMFLYLHERKLHFLAALFGGITFMLFGFQVLWLGHPHTNSFIWIPLILYFTDKLHCKISPYILAGWMFCLLCILLGGHPETIFMSLLVIGAYCLYQDGLRFNHVSRILLIAGLSIFLISSIQWIPFLEYMKNSTALKERSMGLVNDSQAIRSLVTWIFPDFFGNPTLMNEWIKPDIFYQFNYNEAVSGYVGILPLLLGIIGIFVLSRSSYYWFWIITLVLSFILAYDIPIIGKILAHLPGISLIHPKRMVIIISLALIILSSETLSCFLKQNIVKIPAPALLICFLLPLSFIPFKFSPQFLQYFLSPLIDNNIQTVLPYLGTQIYQTTVFWILPSICFLLSLFLLSAKPNFKLRNIMGFGILALTITNLLYFGYGYNPVIKLPYPLEVKCRTDYVNTLSSGRLLSLDEWTAYPPNVATLTGDADIRGYDAVVLNEYENHLRQAQVGFWKDSGPRVWMDPAVNEDEPVKTISLMNVSRIYSSVPLNTKYLKLNTKKNGVLEYLNPETLPRSFGYPDNLFLSQASLKEIQQKSIMAHTHYLNPNHINIDIKMPYKGMVYISENYTNGWKAKLNGKKISVEQINHPFMTFSVPAGNNHLDLIYWPSTLVLGLLLSVSGLFSSITLLVYLCLKGKNKNK